MKKFSQVVFWGTLWGIAEATIGNFLHLWELPIGWLIWFPLAFSFMWAVYRQTKQPGAVVVTAVIAASLKLIDLMISVRPDLVINPAVSILLEGMAVYSILSWSNKASPENSLGFIKTALAGLLWRLVFCFYLWFLPVTFTKTPQISGILPLAQFTLWESTLNSLLINMISKVLPSSYLETAYAKFSPHPVLSFGMLAIAVYIQWRF